MENNRQTNSLELKIQGLLDLYLRRNAANQATENENSHLSEDTLTAFVEGGLSERESQPTIKHLIKCSFCRHVTTELVRLDLAFAEDEDFAPNAADNQPTKISEVLGGILARLFGGNDSAVFAHQETDEADETVEDDAK